MPIALIAAAAGQDLVIGKDGDLPWHYSSDLKFFKEKTLGHCVVMGRVTYQSIVNRLGKPLPSRRNVVLTRDKDFIDPRVTVIHDPSELATLLPKEEWLFVIGGASLYHLTLAQADTLYITHIDKDIAGDTRFPAIDPALWHLSEEITTIEQDTTLRFCTYNKV